MSTIDKIKHEFKKFLQLSEADKIYTDADLKISDKTFGGKVELVNADKTLTTAPDGDYKMQDGDVFTVKDGVIVEINGEKELAKSEAPIDETPNELVTEPAIEAPATPDVQQEVDALKNEINALKTEVEALKKKIADDAANEAKVQASKQEENEKFSKQLEDLTNTIKVLAKLPAEFSKTNTDNIVKDAKGEKMKELAKLLH